MKLKLFASCLLAGCLFSSAQADDKDPAEGQNPVWAIFADEVDAFMDQAQSLKAEGVLVNDDQNRRLILELQETAQRIAGIYFTELESGIRPELEAFLKRKLRENANLDAYLILLGNGFYDRAQIFIADQKRKNQQIKKWSVMGGTALGIAAGGFVLYIKPQIVEGALQKSLLVLGSAAAGAGLGYLGSYAAIEFALPVDPGVENAESFIDLYPDGSSFIEGLETQNQDIADFRDELEEMGG